MVPVWPGVELLDAVEDGVAPLPALRLPLPPLGFEPFGIFPSFDGEAMPGDAAFPLAGVLLIAGFPAAGSGVWAETGGGTNNAAVSAMVERLILV